jgi:DNA-binding CsgD family transcriptional regulator
VIKDFVVDSRSKRMLELLATGAGSRQIAKDMGYQEGTMRVYLHNLYRKIGVANKTEAVVWYLKRASSSPDSILTSAPPAPPVAQRTEDVFGDMALGEGLYAALGVMGAFLGSYSRVWEIGCRLSGEEQDPAKEPQRIRSRALWNALLKGDFAFAKAMNDADESVATWLDAMPDAAMLASLLAIGGYSNAARNFAAKLTDRRRSYGHLAPRDATQLRTLFEALEGDESAVARLTKVAESSTSTAGARQVALALLFHVHRIRRDSERARAVAGALWAEAESARKDLHAMGDRVLGPRAALATAPKTAREKATARG